jgi:hypothetical protein
MMMVLKQWSCQIVRSARQESTHMAAKDALNVPLERILLKDPASALRAPLTQYQVPPVLPRARIVPKTRHQPLKHHVAHVVLVDILSQDPVE